jgi:hypothetical protein
MAATLFSGLQVEREVVELSDDSSEVGPEAAASAFGTVIDDSTSDISSNSEVGASQAAVAFSGVVTGQDHVEWDDSEEEIGPEAAAAAFANRDSMPGPYTASSFTSFQDSWLG